MLQVKVDILLSILAIVVNITKWWPKQLKAGSCIYFTKYTQQQRLLVSEPVTS